MDNYKKADQSDRDAQLTSRTNVIGKSFVTDLWMKVLHRAIDDIVLYSIMRKNDTPFKQEELEFEASAYGFLFDDDYRIPMSDYRVFVHCSCSYMYVDLMSMLSDGQSRCPKCFLFQDEKDVEYRIVDPQKIKDISLSELLSAWKIEDIKGFRIGVKKRIKELIVKKKRTANIRMLAKIKKDTDMAKKKQGNENVQPPSDKELTEFDKGIIKVLDDIKVLLMKKNRKYGNSATNPVRAFSKANAQEQIKVRIDDKISRLVRSKTDDDDEDVIQDLTGYLVILAALQNGYIK